jgi:hypothetical protein
LAGSLMRIGVSPGRWPRSACWARRRWPALLHVLPLPIAVVGFALSFAIGGLVPAATFASVPLVAANARAIGRSTAWWRRPAAWGRWPVRLLLAVWVDWTSWPFRAAAAAHDRGAGRRRSARRQTRFSTT